jgi:hypothetical protein
MADPIRFLDIAQGEEEQKQRITRRLAELQAVLKDANLEIPELDVVAVVAGRLGNGNAEDGETPLQAEYSGLLSRLLLSEENDEPLDRVYRDVNFDVTDTAVVHRGGVFESQRGQTKGLADLTVEELEIAARYGILAREGAVPNYALEDPSPPVDQRFAAAMAKARAEYRSRQPLYDEILAVLVDSGDKRGKVGRRLTDDVSAKDWATIAKKLGDDGVEAGDLYLLVKAQAALGGITGGGDGAAPSSIDIDLPSLEDESTVEIVKDNLKAMQAIYFSSMLEELRLYQVADKLVELFNAGVLPFGKGKGGDLIFDYWRKSNERFTEIERLNLYARCFGFPGGEPMQSPNREFDDLWLRFVSAVSWYSRQTTVDSLLRAAIPAPVSQEGLRKSGRDLAANLSLYGYGVAYFAATALQEQIKDIIEILQTDDVKGAYGARDMWQVVDQIATLELGGARNTVRYRTMAQTGGTIIRWLGDHANELSAFGNIIDDTEVRRNIKSLRPMTEPTDRDLVDACEQWLAVTGTPGQQVEQYSQPVEAPNSTSRPIQIPQYARDVLDSFGVPAGVAGR